MKLKYLSLALAAAMATTGLTACGSDSDSDFEEIVNVDQGDTGGDAGGDTGGDAGGDDTTTDDTTTDDTTTDDTTTDDTTTVDPIDNVGRAAEAFDIETKPSVVGQQYVRGSSSVFDKTASTNSDAADTGNATVLGAETLQNRKMTNIVVAQYADQSVTDAQGNFNNVKYLLGEEPNANPDVNDADSIQTNNDSSLATNNAITDISPFVRVTKTVDDQFNSYYQEAKAPTQNSKLTQNGYVYQTGGNDVRVFGKLSSVNDNTNDANSARYLATQPDGKATVALGTVDQFKVTPLKLNNVQYGRVTGDLENLRVSDIAGQSYIQAQFADKVFNGNTDNTDVYFYRGLGETSIAKMQEIAAKGGTYLYAGHALMYGIDNSYTGTSGNGLSNSVAFGTNAEALGNFVKATYDAGNEKVTGSVYNVWDRDTSNAEGPVSVDLVTFDGSVTGNTIKGTADRTYSAGDDGAAFKGSFFGNNAQEMGGSFNSITEGYDKAEWGGVFGAQKVVAEVEVDEDPFVPPINAVE